MNIIDTNLKFKRKLPCNNSPKSIVLHHTECNGWTVERLHQLHKSRGWVGIGYHFYIRKDGSIYKGRPEWTMGAHCKGFNKNSLGITFEGNYMIDKTMPLLQMKAGLELISYLKNKYGDMKIYGHKEVGSSDCPGTYFPLQTLKNNNCNNSLDGRIGICTGNAVRVRSTTNINSSSNILGHLFKGYHVKIFKKVGNMYSIYYGPHGAYVSANYIELI